MKKILIVTFILLNVFSTVIYCQSINFADEKSIAVKSMFQYDILVENEDIGDSKIHVIKAINGTVVLHELSHIKTSGFLGKVDLTSSLTEEFSKNGSLFKADIKERVNKKVFWTQLQSVENEIWATRTQIKKLSEIQEQQFIDISVGLLANMVSNVGEIIAISQLIFSDDEEATESLQKNLRIDKTSFDTTFISIPHLWQNNQYQFPAEMTILDTELLSVYPAKIEYVAKEFLMNTESHEVLTDHYRIMPPKSAPIDIWLAKDPQNVPHFVQIVGEDKDGKFKIKLK